MNKFFCSEWKKIVVAATVIVKASCKGQACEDILISSVREEENDLLQVVNAWGGPVSAEKLRKEYEKYIGSEDYISLILNKIEEMLEI